MSDGRKGILSTFTGRKKKKLGARPEERRQNLAETDRWLYYNQGEWLEEFLDGKGAFYSVSESDDSDNDGENYNENNEQQQLYESFASSCYKVVSPIPLQELINDFAVSKHCSEILLLVKMELVATILETRPTHFKKEPHLIDQPRTYRIFMLCCIKAIYFN